MLSYKASCPKESFRHIERIEPGRYAIRWDEKEQETDEGLFVSYNETVLFEKPTMDSLVTRFVREKYSESDELSLARQSFAKINEFTEYNSYVEQCKKWACGCLDVEYVPTYAPTLSEVMNQMKILSKNTVELLPDEEAVNVPSLFDEWKPDVKVEENVRKYYGGKLYKCIQPHYTQRDWMPDLTPSLWKLISVEEWPEWVQPLGAADAYSTGDKVSHNGQHWVSLIDANIWEPTESVPTLWESR